MAKVMLRLNISEPTRAVEELVTAWLKSEGITIHTGGDSFSADITYVKELG